MGGTLIDHLYCSSPEKVISTYILLSDISNYFPIYVKLKNCNLIKITQRVRINILKTFPKLTPTNFS